MSQGNTLLQMACYRNALQTVSFLLSLPHINVNMYDEVCNDVLALALVVDAV